MRFDIVTIFPEMFSSYFSESILGRAQKEKLIKIKTHNLRDYATDKHNTVDDTPYGGGAGMVMKVEPIFNCVERIKNDICDKKKCKKTAIDNFKEIFQRTGSRIVKNSKTRTSSRISNFRDDGEKVKIKSRIILFSAKGKKYTQQDAERLAKYDNLILICGRYEGVDERVAKHIADEEISIGDYVLTGGEVPAMIIVDSVSRLLPKVLGNEKSLEEESHRNVEGVEDERNDLTLSTSQKRYNDFNEPKAIQRLQRAERYLEYPQYTKPAEFNNWKVPKVLLSGNHQKIKEWRDNFYKK